MANTYGLNVIKIGRIWIFWGCRSPLLGGGGLHVACDFRTRISYSSQKSCVKIWFWLVEPFKSYHLNFPWGQKPPIRGGGGCMWPAMLIFGLGWAIPVKSHLCKFGSNWLSLSRIIVSTTIFLWGRNPPIQWVTFDLWCPFLNSDELFQSEAMCGNLVWIDWNRRYVNLEGGRPLVKGGGVYMWPAMPIFELGRGCLDKSHVWKFGSDFLSLSKVIVGTNQMTRRGGRGRGRGWRRGQNFLK